jgi:hypothetical protein
VCWACWAPRRGRSAAAAAAHHEAAVAVGRLQHVPARALGLLRKPLNAGHAAEKGGCCVCVCVCMCVRGREGGVRVCMCEREGA